MNRFTLKPRTSVISTVRHSRVVPCGAGLLLFLLGLLLGLALSFPSAALKNKLLTAVEANGQVRIEAGQLSLSPLLTLTGSNARIVSLTVPAPPLRIDSFRVAPEWMSLLSATPGAKLQARLLGGQLQANLHRNGACDLNADNLALDLPLLQGSGMRLTGLLLQASGQSSQLPLQKSSESELQLVFSNVQLAGLPGLSQPLQLGTISLQTSGRGLAFKITTLTAEGGDFQLSGRGSLLLGRDLPSSRINLRAEIRPTPQADPGLVSLLELAARQGADGALELNLSGRLAKPSLK